MIGFFAIVVLVAAALCAAYWRWRRGMRAELAEGAEIEWEGLRRNDPELIGDMTRARFDEVYARVHGPRFPGYALAAFVSFLLALPVIFGLLVGAQVALDAMGATPEPAVAQRLFVNDAGELIFFKNTPPEAALYFLRDLAGFYYFFGVLLAWLGIVAFFTHRYHRRHPGILRDELIRAREESRSASASA